MKMHVIYAHSFLEVIIMLCEHSLRVKFTCSRIAAQTSGTENVFNLYKCGCLCSSTRISASPIKRNGRLIEISATMLLHVNLPLGWFHTSVSFGETALQIFQSKTEVVRAGEISVSPFFIFPIPSKSTSGFGLKNRIKLPQNDNLKKKKTVR